MAFIPDLTADRENSPARTTDGLRWSCLPDTGLDELVERPAECFDGATLVHDDVMTRHGIAVPFGEDPDERVPGTERIDADNVRALFAALNILAHIHHPILYGTIHNAGDGADNYYQELTAEIVSVSGSTLTVAGVGWNPKRIQMGRSRLNPAWPLPDPVTGSGARIIYETEAFALMVLSEVQFLLPSVLAGKLRPFVKSITMPESDDPGATFTVELSNDCSFAKTPYDLAFPPANGKYFLRFLCFAFRPARWPNVQPTGWAHWKRRTQVVTSEDAAAAPVPLLNASAHDTRVLWPDMMPNAFRVFGEPTGGADVEIPNVQSRLSTVQSGGGHVTTLDLQDLAATYESFTIVFWAEAESGDEGTFPFPGRCMNSQSDPSGSYVHADGRRCTAVESASGFGAFRGECWQPGGGCSKFCLPKYRTENAVRPPTDLVADNLMAAAICGTSWVLVQAAPGFSGPGAFHLERPSDAMDSLMEFAGGWAAALPIGLYAQRTPWIGPAFGQLDEIEDGGNITLSLRPGAFVGRGNWTAGTTPPEGLFPANVSGFADELTDWRGEDRTARLARYMQTPAGTGHLYNLGVQDEGMQIETRLVESEAFAVGLDPTGAPDGAVQAAVLAIVNGTG